MRVREHVYVLQDRNSINLICYTNDHEINNITKKRKNKMYTFSSFPSLYCRICFSIHKRTIRNSCSKHPKCAIFSPFQCNSIVLRRRHFLFSSNSDFQLQNSPSLRSFQFFPTEFIYSFTATK